MEAKKKVMNILRDPFFGVYLNPGHLIHRDEWMNSPIYENSKEKIFSMLETWLKEPYSGGRHQNRLNKLDNFHVN